MYSIIFRTASDLMYDLKPTIQNSYLDPAKPLYSDIYCMQSPLTNLKEINIKKKAFFVVKNAKNGNLK